MRLKDVGYIVGAVILAGSIFVFARASISQGDSYTEPLTIPVSFAAGSEKTAQIATKIDWNFELVIDIQENQLRSQPTNTDMAWQILDDGDVVAQGSSVDKPWQNWWGTFEQRLGAFSARAGRHYMLKLHVNHGDAQLDPAGPILKVRIPRGDWEGYGAGVAIEKLASGVLGFIGLVIIGCSFQLRRRSRNERAEENS